MSFNIHNVGSIKIQHLYEKGEESENAIKELAGKQGPMSRKKKADAYDLSSGRIAISLKDNKVALVAATAITPDQEGNFKLSWKESMTCVVLAALDESGQPMMKEGKAVYVKTSINSLFERMNLTENEKEIFKTATSERFAEDAAIDDVVNKWLNLPKDAWFKWEREYGASWGFFIGCHIKKGGVKTIKQATDLIRQSLTNKVIARILRDHGPRPKKSQQLKPKVEPKKLEPEGLRTVILPSGSDENIMINSVDSLPAAKVRGRNKMNKQEHKKKRADLRKSKGGMSVLQSEKKSQDSNYEHVKKQKVVEAPSKQESLEVSSKQNFVTLRFPKEEAIIAYLEKHPLTNDPYLKEKKIIGTIAKFFADQDKAPIGVDMGVMLTMMDLNEKIGLPQMSLQLINLNLSEALKDCANGKKIKEVTG